MKWFLRILIGVFVAATVDFVLWTVEESTKTLVHSWVWLAWVWSVVLIAVTLTLLVLTKRIINLPTGKGLLAVLGIILIGAAAGDTFYVGDILKHSDYWDPDVFNKMAIGQCSICIALWIIGALACLFAFRRKNRTAQ